MKTATRIELDVVNHYRQSRDEDGNLYDYQAGYVIQGQVFVGKNETTGFCRFEIWERPGVFTCPEKARRVVDRLCGTAENGFFAEIDLGAEDWVLVGTNY